MHGVLTEFDGGDFQFYLAIKNKGDKTETKKTETIGGIRDNMIGTSELDWSQYDAEQIRLMGEQCIVTTTDDEAVRPGSKKECHLMTNINTGLLHRAFSVFLFDRNNRLMLQQRSEEKITFPGYFTNTCCSHPLYTADEMDGVDGAKVAVQRKLQHELGIDKSQVPLDRIEFVTRIHYLAPSDSTWGEHEIDYIFIVKLEVDLVFEPNRNEVKSTRFVTKDELKLLFDTADEKNIKLTPWFRLIVDSFLYNWWDHMDDLKPLQDSTIHRL